MKLSETPEIDKTNNEPRGLAPKPGELTKKEIAGMWLHPSNWLILLETMRGEFLDRIEAIYHDYEHAKHIAAIRQRRDSQSTQPTNPIQQSPQL
jgi:hypothetical protein